MKKKSNKLRYQVYMEIEVDADANFLEVENGHNSDVVLEVLEDMMYDIDDVTVKEIEVKYDE